MDNNIDVASLPPPPAWMTGGKPSAPPKTPDASDNVDVTKLPPPPAWMTQNAQSSKTATPQNLLDQIPGSHSSAQTPQTPPAAGQAWYQKALGAVTAPMDVAAGMLQSAGNTIAGNLYGIGKEIATGNFGHGLAERTSAQFQDKYGYRPASPQGAAALQGAGNLINQSGIAGIGPDMSTFSTLDTLGGPAAGQLARGAKAEAGILGETARAAGGKLAPMIPEPVGRAARAVGQGASYLVNPEASAGAKGARAFTQDLEQQIPVPGAKPVTPEPPPMPKPAVTVPAGIRASKPSTIQINEDLAKAMEARGVALDAARKQAGDQIESTIAKTPQSRLTPDSPLYNDLGKVKDSLVQEQENAGTGAQRAAMQSVINDIEHIRNNSNTPLSSLIDLRRQLSQKAKFGQEVTGFDAIGTQASASLSGQLNAVLDKHIDGYEAARAKYGNVLDEQSPFRTRLLKSLGADETTGADLSAKIMQSPQNLNLAVEAAGGVKPVDAALSKRVIADLQGKSPDAIAAYIDEHKPIFDKLPQTAKTANDLLSKAEVSQALQSIQKASEARFKADIETRNKALNQQADIYTQQEKAYTASHDLAAKYQGEFTAMNKLPATKLPTELRTVLKKMYDDKIITPQKYSDALDQVKLFEKSINRQKYVRRFTGAATAVGFAQYALHRKMWNIIVGATD